MFDSAKLLAPISSKAKLADMSTYFSIPEGVISLALGEPGTPTPSIICEGAKRSLDEGHTFYAPSLGISPLRSAIARYLKRRFAYEYSPEEVVVTASASLAFDCAIRAFIAAGDEVIIPAPAYGFYSTAVELSGGVPVYLYTSAEEGFKLSPQALEKAITAKTKLLVLNYPANPTGAALGAEEYAALARVLARHEILVIADEIYAELAYGARHHSILEQAGMRERTLLISGFSKLFSMTGWRIGYMCAPKELLASVSRIHTAAILCAPCVAQYAALAGLEAMSAGKLNAPVSEYKAKRDYLISRIERLGWSSRTPEGAFFIWADISNTSDSSIDFCEGLLRCGGVAIVPGSFFGGEGYAGYVRISYGAAMETIREAFERIERYLKNAR